MNYETHAPRIWENPRTQKCPTPNGGGEGGWTPRIPETSHPHGRGGGGVDTHPPTQNCQDTPPPRASRRRTTKPIPGLDTPPITTPLHPYHNQSLLQHCTPQPSPGSSPLSGRRTLRDAAPALSLATGLKRRSHWRATHVTDGTPGDGSPDVQDRTRRPRRQTTDQDLPPTDGPARCIMESLSRRPRRPRGGAMFSVQSLLKTCI